VLNESILSTGLVAEISGIPGNDVHHRIVSGVTIIPAQARSNPANSGISRSYHFPERPPAML
jgi:hypothetical protein